MRHGSISSTCPCFFLMRKLRNKRSDTLACDLCKSLLFFFKKKKKKKEDTLEKLEC